MREADFSSREYESWVNSNLLLQCGRTYPGLFPLTLDEILQQSSPHFENAGHVTSHGELLTLNIVEYHNAGAVCALSQILEANAPLKYYLSPKAAAGILRRAEKRGRELPEPLRAALEALAHTASPTEATGES